MKQLKIGFLGAGHIARTHGKSLRQMPGVDITAVCDNQMDQTEGFITELGLTNTKAFDNFDTMLNSCELDAVYICLPPFAHTGQVEAAAEKGIHVFIEKPIALDSARGKSMVEAVKKAGIMSQVGYHMRFGDAVQELKRLIKEGKAGLPTLIDARYACNSLHSPWWRDKSKSGGQVFEQVIHSYDIAMYLMGLPVVVSGFQSNLCHQGIENYTVEDTSVASIRFQSGALASIVGTNCAVPGEWNSTFTVVCSNLTVHFEDANKAEFIFTNQEPVTRRIVNGKTDMYLAESQAFIAALRGEEPNICTIEEGYNSLLLVESMTLSADKQGQPVSLTF